MPDLAIAPPAERSPLRAILIATAVMAFVVVAVFLLNPRKTAVVTVPNVQLFSPHTDFKATTGSMHIIGAAAQSEDDLYVVATVRVENKLRLPIYVSSWSATLTDKDNTQSTATVIAASDFPRITRSFPTLAPMLAHPLTYSSEVAAGQFTEGTVLLLFPTLKQDDWHTKKTAAFTISFLHQNSQTVALP